MDKLTIKDVEVAGKRVLVRVDFNVPLDKKTGEITDDSRIRAAMPTIEYLTGKGAKVILCSHLGRPDGKVVESMRLGVVAERLSVLRGRPVGYVKDCVGSEAEKAVGDMSDGNLLLLENLRFHPEEEANEPGFSRALASLAEVYVDDAFGTVHRKHASVVGVTKYLPAVAGLLVEKELAYLGGIMERPERPFGGLFGGAKVSDKVEMLENIMDNLDFLLIGGGMAATFLKSEGYETGLSMIEEDRIETAAGIIKKAAEKDVELLLPADVAVAYEIEENSSVETVNIDSIPPDKRIVDIGSRTAEKFAGKLKECRTVFWNGTMGVHEIAAFASGTRAVAETLAGLEAVTVLGGGSTSEAVTGLGLADKMTFISTGGGASLKFLGGQKLPGVEALLDKSK